MSHKPRETARRSKSLAHEERQNHDQIFDLRLSPLSCDLLLLLFVTSTGPNSDYRPCFGFLLHGCRQSVSFSGDCLVFTTEPLISDRSQGIDGVVIPAKKINLFNNSCEPQSLFFHEDDLSTVRTKRRKFLAFNRRRYRDPKDAGLRRFVEDVVSDLRKQKLGCGLACWDSQECLDVVSILESLNHHNDVHPKDPELPAMMKHPIRIS